MTNTLRLLTILIFALGLNACGGGGGSSSRLDSANATVVIDPTNAIDIIRSVDDTNAIAEELVLNTVVGAAGVSSATVSAANNTANLTARAAAQSTEYCTSGTADVTEDLPVIVFSFVDCQDFVYTSSTLGDVSVTGILNGIQRIEVSLTSQSTDDYQADITLTDFSIDDSESLYRADGKLELDYQASANTSTATIAARSLDFSQDAASRSVEDYRFSQEQKTTQKLTASMGGVTSSNFDLLAYFETPQPFIIKQGNLWPSAGSQVIYGAAGNRIKVSPLSDGLNARVELDLDEVDDFEISCEYTWEELLGDSTIIACEIV